MSAALPPSPVDVNKHDNFQLNVIICSVVTFLIAATFVCLRFYTRGRLLKVLGWEDWTNLGGLIFSGAQSAFYIAQVVYGVGKNFVDISRADAFISLKVR
jgi:hypothetical protein